MHSVLLVWGKGRKTAKKVDKGMDYSGSHDLQTLLITETWLSAA